MRTDSFTRHGFSRIGPFAVLGMKRPWLLTVFGLFLSALSAKADLRYWESLKDLENVSCQGEILQARSSGGSPIFQTGNRHLDPGAPDRVTVAMRSAPINVADADIVIETVSFDTANSRGTADSPRPAPRREAGDTAARPNILILLTDDQRWDTIGVNNPDLAIQTPNIDRLADEGVNFANGFVTTPICAVSRASIISGRYARNAEVHCFLIPFPEDVFPTTYPVLLKEAGYFTGQLGKYGVGATREQQDFYDFFDGDLAQGEAFKEYDGERLHDSEWLTRRTRDFLDKVPDGKPFVLQVNYKAPHPSAAVAPEDEGTLAGVAFPAAETDTPEDAANLPPEVRRGLGGASYSGDFGTPERRNRWIGRYLEKILSVERSVGAILSELEERGLADKTVVIYFSDHGTHFGEKQLTGKWTPYEESLRVPFIVYDPRARETAGSVREELVLNIDIAPTLVELAGLNVPAEMDGSSLLSLVRGEDPVDWRNHFFFEHQTSPAMVARPVPRNMGVRSETGKYLIWTDPVPPVEEFYDLVEDPIERFNLIDSAPERAEGLRTVFEQWEVENPDTYTYMPYSHRPQSHAPDLDRDKLKEAHPAAFRRIAAALEERGSTWEEALEDRDLRWEIGLEAGHFY